MYLVDDIILATRTFRTRKLRTFLTILGISIGIGAIMFLVSLGYGMQRVLLENITKLDALLSLDVASGDVPIDINNALLDEFRSIPNVEEVSPVRVVSSTGEYNNVSTGISFYAVDKAYFRLDGIILEAGKVFESNDDRGVILSRGALTSLGIEGPEEALGKRIRITLFSSNEALSEENLFVEEGSETKTEGVSELPGDFAIAGVVDDESNSFGYIPLLWSSGLGLETYDGVKVRVGEQSHLEGVRKELITRGMTVLALSDTIDQANKIFSVVQTVLALFGLVALFVSAIGMFNTMTIALLERTGEIGTMKSIGASDRDIRIMFLVESVIIGFLGGVGGLIIGASTSWFVNFVFNGLADRLGGQAVDLFVTPFWFVAFIIIFSTFIGLLTGVYPAERAARLNPLVALRYR